jgi:hypothetical protein
MLAEVAFRTLDGKADSGSTGQQADPVLGYDYPISRTGNADSLDDDNVRWWQFCIGHGRC